MQNLSVRTTSVLTTNEEEEELPKIYDVMCHGTDAVNSFCQFDDA